MTNTEKKAKVIFLGKLPPPYIGPAVAVGIILNSKLKEKFDLIHLDTSDHRDINTLGKFDLINILLPLKHYFLLIWLIIKHRPKLVYFPSAQTTVAFLRDIPFVMITKLFRKKVVAHLRGGNFRNWYDSCGKMMKWLVKKIQKKIDAQIVLGENLRSMFKELMPDEKIFVVPNGGDFKIPLIKKNNKNPTKVLFLSNFIRTKGILDLLYAIPIIFKKIQNVEFIFAGSWTDVTVKEEFTTFVNENKILPIKVIGPVFGSFKYELLGTVDIFVLPTYYPNEGHPWVIVEAMAAGLPIISTDQGTITESVIDGVNGFIIEKQNKEQIAEKIIHLITNPPLRKKMECENRRLYLENFTESKMVTRFYEIFINII